MQDTAQLVGLLLNIPHLPVDVGPTGAASQLQVEIKKQVYIALPTNHCYPLWFLEARAASHGWNESRGMVIPLLQHCIRTAMVA